MAAGQPAGAAAITAAQRKFQAEFVPTKFNHTIVSSIPDLLKSIEQLG
jgi:hypothetical protein